jgi:hypothetical protein
MTKGLLRGFRYVAIETTQQSFSCRSDPVDASTSIASVGVSHDEAFAGQARDQTSQI